MAQSTKRALATSLKALLTKRSLDKITVKDVVETCGVNRQTFYYHFHDIYELVEWCFQDELETLAGSGIDYDDWASGLETLMEYLRRERVLVLNAYHSVSHEVVVDYIKKLLRPYLLQTVQRQAEGLTPHPTAEDIDFVTDIFMLTITGTITEWIGHRMDRPDTEQRLHKLQLALSGSVQFLLGNLAARRD